MSQNPSIRRWAVFPDPETGEVDPDEAAAVAVDVSTVLRMCGGTATWATQREEILTEMQEPTGLFATVALWCTYHPFAPAERAQQQPQEQPQQQQQRPNGQGQRKRRRNRGRGGGGGQPPQQPQAARPLEVVTEPTFANDAGAAFQNQPEPEPQEPQEALGPNPAVDIDPEETRPADEFVPLTPEEEQVLREEGALP
jgi:hypothetical protein